MAELLVRYANASKRSIPLLRILWKILDKKFTRLVHTWNEVTILWNEVTIWWNEVAKGWNEVVWNEVAVIIV